MKVAYLPYAGFTALNVVGAFQVLATAPGARSDFVAARAGAWSTNGRVRPAGDAGSSYAQKCT